MSPKRPPAGSRRAPTDATRLTRDHWLDAAFAAVADAGFDHLRVLSLANQLNVTRGSFYWHFTDHAALVQALIERWREGELALIARVRESPGGSPAQDLIDLLDVALARAGQKAEAMRFELALRSLGRRDATVASMLATIDASRLSLFESSFQRLTHDSRRSSELAALFYLAIVGGHQALSRPASDERMASYLKSVIGEYLVRRQAG